MTLRERILAVYRGQTPDVVPYMLDLSHWFYQRNRLPWDLTTAYEKPETALIDYHKKASVGFYMPNLASFYSVKYAADVRAEVGKGLKDGSPEIAWRLETPLGAIDRRRVWEESSYSWAISRWGIRDERGLRILARALRSRVYAPLWDNYRAWNDYVGDTGVVYALTGYSAIGHIMHYWMGVEGTIFAAADWPATLHEAVDEINANNLDLIDLLAESPAEIICMGDNFSSDVQPPGFFNQWSRDYYREAIGRLHAAGKCVAVHIDGRLRGALRMMRDAGADCADAVTPAPFGDLSPAGCRAEAGSRFILSGGVPPNLWLPDVPVGVFRKAVMDWLDLKESSPRLIANAGDQVPPGADETRIAIMGEMVDQFGRY
jgi:Uroporphyrinogen decarboxylase (URO-D)